MSLWDGERSLDATADQLSVYGAALRRSRLWLAACFVVGLAAALVYGMKTPAQFVSHIDIVIAPRSIANDGPEDRRHFHQLDLDSEQAATELQILQSEGLLRAVFDSLGLAKSPELSRWRDGFWTTVVNSVHDLWPRAASDDDHERAYFAYLDRVRCLQTGLSYVFECIYRSHDPELAARVANALAAEYLGDRIDRERTRQARIGGTYHAERAQALTRQWQISQAAVASGLPLTGDLVSADARTLGPAVASLDKAYPKLGPIVATGGGIGLLFGVFAVLALQVAFPDASPRRPVPRPAKMKRATRPRMMASR